MEKDTDAGDARDDRAAEADKAPGCRLLLIRKDGHTAGCDACDGQRDEGKPYDRS